MNLLQDLPVAARISRSLVAAMDRKQKTQGEAFLARRSDLGSPTDTKRRSTKSPANTNGNTRLTQETKALRLSLGRSLRSARNENGRRISQPRQIPNGDPNQNPLGVVALLHQEDGGEPKMIPSGDPSQVKKGAVAKRMKVEVVAALKIMVGGNIKVNLQLHPASEELAPNGAAGPAIGVDPAVEMRIVMMFHHAGCTRSLHPNTVKRRRRRKRKTRAVSIPIAAHGLAGAIPHTAPPSVLTQVAQRLLQTRAAIAGSTVILMTAIVTIVTDREGTQSAPMTLMTQTTPAPSTGPNGTNIHLPMTIASVAASPEAGLGVIPETAQDPGAAAAAVVAAAAGANGEAVVPQPTAGSEAAAIAGTAAAAPEALPKDPALGKDHGVMRALRRGVLVVETSFAPKSTAPSLLIISDQVGEKAMRKRKMAEEMIVKGPACPPRTAVLAQEGDQRVTAALKIRTLSLPNFYWRRSSQGKWRGNSV